MESLINAGLSAIVVLGIIVIMVVFSELWYRYSRRGECKICGHDADYHSGFNEDECVHKGCECRRFAKKWL